MAGQTPTARLELPPLFNELRATQPRVIEEILAVCPGRGRHHGEGCEDGQR